MKKQLPKHYNQTYRQYKKQKRKEFKRALEDMIELRFGCAYLPPSAYLQFDKAMKSLEKAYENCKPWWRNA